MKPRTAVPGLPFAKNAAVLAILGLCFFFPQQSAATEEPEWRHAAALNGEPKYGPGTKHFDYVNPDAPKGGLVRLSTSGGFDSFNLFLPKGNIVPGLLLIYESLMEPSLDEADISAQYGVLAEALRYPEDYSWVEYRMNPNAKWHDGQPVSAEDVVWSFETVTDLDPRQRFYYHHVEKAEVVGDNVVRFTFDGSGNRELPKIIGNLTILPKHWWQGTGPDGEPRDITRSTSLEPPLGSGPYRIKDFDANRQVTYERVPEYWGAELPIRVGTNNFDEIRYISFLDGTVAFEAFKGDQYDFRLENVAKNWATGYKFPAVEAGDVVLETFDDKATGIMQAFVVNLRRDKFKDVRVRKALNLAFDFETTNRTVFFDQYKRIDSFFAGTELASSGAASGRELEILEEVQDLVPPEVFDQVYRNPVNGDSRKLRGNLREALKLLREAGYRLEGGTLVNDKTGEPFTIEFVDSQKSSERYALPYVENLNRIGIDMSVRVLDTPQYINRIRSRDFDMTTLGWAQSLSPGNEQRNYWGSEAADQEQSQNYAGIADKGIDALIDKVVFATDRKELVASTRALDRALMANHYVIPQWYLNIDRTARWNRFGHPETMPEYTFGFPTIWWYDEALAEKTGAPK
ncbi:extracellular solute-binding protein [Roseibium sp. RKSG952]|uniref:extracellular solute-binding protein n=1 Tax=Roseibium sp. RKSG952 TaxID=2529384 RepID=UPI0012BC239D|nr:extracellular solute-binding protein [Roseibium sp. RKSG952]MTH99711.1 ABC transporter substrate-binding protein [Roseibium sp. RKSG952]